MDLYQEYWNFQERVVAAEYTPCQLRAKATVLRLIISLVNSWWVHILEKRRVPCDCAILAFGCDHTVLLARHSHEAG